MMLVPRRISNTANSYSKFSSFIANIAVCLVSLCLGERSSNWRRFRSVGVAVNRHWPLDNGKTAESGVAKCKTFNFFRVDDKETNWKLVEMTMTGDSLDLATNGDIAASKTGSSSKSKDPIYAVPSSYIIDRFQRAY